ncbi:MAG: type III secretion system export apparatus subunit SctU [Parachlamydia sp.]|nr:type III secretion system export apparatus subunit SctU [Parachlamydia sp.]
MAEKTEKATPKKLRDAKKKGQVAKSQDLPAAFTFIVSIWVTLGLGHFMYEKMTSFLVGTFHMIGHQDLIYALKSIITNAIVLIFVTSLPVLVITSFVGVAVTFVTVGPVWAPEVFKFDPKKFDPIQNLKGKFKLKTFVELIKSLIKITLACWIIYTVMWKSMPVLIQTVMLKAGPAMLVFNAFLMEVLIKVGLLFIVIAVMDFAYQKKDFAKEMMMEKFEVKQEYKNTEGDPLIKSKRRQIAQEIAYSEGPTGGVKRAQAVVTNPTHIAVAIGYNKELDSAPYIIAMGQDILAERIITLAQRHKIPVIRNIRLARKLWDEGEVHEYVPEDAYEAIAEVLRWISALNTEEAYEYSERAGE